MNKQYTNPCTRCGKERIILRTWQERIQTFSGAEIIQTNSDTICPDPQCQKMVNKDLRSQRKKRDKIKQEKEQRLLSQKTNNPRNKKKN